MKASNNSTPMSTNKTGVTEDQQAEIDKAQMEIMGEHNAE
jgi:hypothetical protein